MKVETLSLKSVTALIFVMLTVVAIVLAVAASGYFKQSALDAQVKSLSRVMEVATREVLNQVRHHSFDLGTKLGHSRELIGAVSDSDDGTEIGELLDDPFINGFVGSALIDLVKLRIFDPDLKLLAQSRNGLQGLEPTLNPQMIDLFAGKAQRERLKALDVLWISPQGPLFSTLVPIGGLRPVAYLEIIVDPAFNLPNVGRLTEAEVRVFDVSRHAVAQPQLAQKEGYLPVSYLLHASDGEPAFSVVGYENIVELNRDMDKTRLVTITGFLLLTLLSLLFALWLFKRFFISPMGKLVKDMARISRGKLDSAVDDHGLYEFHLLANAFNSMTEQVRLRTAGLERLLDLDHSALMCFDRDSDAVYFNRGAAELFGYDLKEISDLDLRDFFVEDVAQLVSEQDGDDTVHLLHGIHKDGHQFEGEASLKVVDVLGNSGIAVVISSGHQATADSNEQERLQALEETINHLLSIAKEGAEAPLDVGASSEDPGTQGGGENRKSLQRKQAVNVMTLALSCWTRDLGKSKIDLAEQSRIWPVYMDKSTPTTRTLDKYLNIERCPKNPRHQRVVETAEFVLDKAAAHGSERYEQLHMALENYRNLLSGID